MGVYFSPILVIFLQKLDKENLRCSINELVYITAKGYLKVSGIKIPMGDF